MNFLIKKEIRLLLPAWIVAMLLVICTPSIPGRWVLGTSGTPIGFILGLLLLGIASFGQEFSSGSFSALLSQPMDRRQIWNVKTKMLACAFILVFAAWVVHIVFLNDVFRPFSWEPVGSGPLALRVEPLIVGRYVLLAIAIFTGSLWSTLLLRQIVAAFGLTLLLPLAMIFWIEIISDHCNWNETFSNAIVDAVLASYSIAGFLWARRLFLYAQDAQWTGGDFSFPWRAKISGQKMAILSKPPRHWLGALAWKEILLHQANLLIAALILTLQSACNFMLKIHPHFRDPDIKYILESAWVLWLLMPLLIGSAAVAEERKLGAIESQLTLPVSRRFQLAIKFSTGLFLSLLLGFIGLGLSSVQDFVFFAAIYFLSFYTSSLARTTLQAIGLATLTLFVVYSYESQLFFLSAPWAFNPASPLAPVFVPLGGREILRHFFSWPILTLAFGGLAYWNFKWLHQNRKLWGRNLIVLFTAFASISILANAIYFRAWELVLPIEHSPGPVRLSAANQPKFFVSNGSVFTRFPYGPVATNQDGFLSTLLPDGRLWTEWIRFSDADRPGSTFLSSFYSRFIGGTNWISAALFTGIQSDGTLWQFKPDSGQPTQIGTDTNWLQVTGGSSWLPGFVLLKNDGTLWFWRGNPGDLLQRVGNGTNCMKIFSSSGIEGPITQKTDGSLWGVIIKANSIPCLYRLREPSGIIPGIQKIRMPPGYIELSTNGDLSFSPFQMPPVFVRSTNGDMLISAYPRAAKGRSSLFQNFPLGQNAKWKDLATYSMRPFDDWFTIRSDGTLWQWKLPMPYNVASREMWAKIQPVQVGGRSDWVALVPVGIYGSRVGSPLALAADGSLWAWNQPSRHIWMAPSRKPVYMGNIFQGSAASVAANP